MKRFASTIVLAIALFLPSPSGARPAFLELEFGIPGALSGDGSIAVGSRHGVLARWTREEGVVTLGRPPDGPVHPLGLSPDASVIAGNVGGANQPGFRWTEAGGFELVPRLRVRGVSGDGSVLVGDLIGGGFIGARWVDGDLELLDTSAAFAASFDGSVLAVLGGRWENGVVTDLPPVPGRLFNEVTSVSADGSTIVGTSQGPGIIGDAALWLGLRPLSLGRLPGDDFAVARAVSGDGSVVVGTSHRLGPFRQRAFVWSPELGMRSLRGHLQQDLGLDLAGWGLDEVVDVSDDGRTILGTGLKDGARRTWVAVLDAALPLDNFSCYPVLGRRHEGRRSGRARAGPIPPSGASWRITGRPSWYCVPSEKTRFDPPTVEPVVREPAHLACYAARSSHGDESEDVRRVAVRSQFRERELFVHRERAVCVPTLEGDPEDPERALAALEAALDDFSCYASREQRRRRQRGVGESILARDSLFGELDVEVGRERLVCSPGAVIPGREREERVAVEGPDHLACFGVESEDDEEERPEVREIAITNRFVRGETIALRGEPRLFCDAAFVESLPPREDRRHRGRWRPGDRPRDDDD